MTENPPKELSRNEPCHCGSGKKYKRCHGVAAAPKLGVPKASLPNLAGGAPGGFDPSQFDPQMLMQFSQMLSRLPKGQMQKLQGLMQRAMAGKDVSREAAEFERTLPVDIQEALRGMMQMTGQVPAAAVASAEEPEADLSVDEARRIVEEAVASGKLSREEADKLLNK